MKYDKKTLYCSVVQEHSRFLGLGLEYQIIVSAGTVFITRYLGAPHPHFGHRQDF